MERRAKHFFNDADILRDAATKKGRIAYVDEERANGTEGSSSEDQSGGRLPCFQKTSRNIRPYVFVSILSSQMIILPVSVLDRISLPTPCLNFNTARGRVYS